MAAILGVLKGEEADAGGATPGATSEDRDGTGSETGDELPEPSSTPATG
jgi:hypothetical protein